MSIKMSQRVPREKFKVFYDIIKSCDGRFLEEPRGPRGDDSWYVYVEFQSGEQFKKFNRAWDRANTNIVEVKSSFWKILWRKIKGIYYSIVKE